MRSVRLGELIYYLGITITHDCSAKTMYIDEGSYIRKICKKYHMDNSLPLRAPSTSTNELPINDIMATADQRQLYQGMIGSALYVVVWTCPNILEQCSELGQYAYNPRAEHLSALHNLYAYLNGTLSLGICYNNKSSQGLEIHSFGLTGFSESSYANPHLGTFSSLVVVQYHGRVRNNQLQRHHTLRLSM